MNIEWYIVLSSLLFAVGAMRDPDPAQPGRDPALPRADAERRQPGAGRLQPHGRQPAGAGLRAGRDGRRRLRGGRRPRPDRRDLPPQAAARRRRAAGADADERHHLGLAGPALPAARLDRDRARLPGDPGPRRRRRSAPSRSRSPSPAAIARPDQPARRTPDARHHASSLWNYASAAGLDIKLGIFVDPLSVFMVLVVTGVSTLIHLYSFGYMQSDEGYHRFFSYLNFFVFSMLLLVLAGNFVLLIVGWAFVGFASYALISFWYRRTTATTRRDEGLRDQRRRRHRPRPRRLPDLPRTGDLRLRRGLRQGAPRLPHQRLDA